ncbi:hypothetical protein BPA30113_04849 [Burkholderia paludis]|uniref:Uncharacterized protein n=1 Tax=Burkholderia paludis TaxID=1506587 RepID=A0A6P2P7H9_9BURK|nr:hypothetical protein BPA30113_04849 [Burkholderia paludis]
MPMRGPKSRSRPAPAWQPPAPWRQAAMPGWRQIQRRVRVPTPMQASTRRLEPVQVSMRRLVLKPVQAPTWQLGPKLVQVSTRQREP